MEDNKQLYPQKLIDLTEKTFLGGEVALGCCCIGDL